MLRADEFKQGASLGKYEIIKKLAVGGMAEIYLARVRGTAGFEKLVVLKRILPSVAEDANFVQMFLDEARLAATLRHPNIADVFDVGAEDDSYYFAMEFIHGQDVRTIRVAAYELDRDIPIEIALAIISGTAYALTYAHAKTGPNGPLGIVHRDITPSNIIVSYDGAVKLVDFGIARADSRNSVKTRTGTLKGKVPYMSPEQCRGKPLDRRSDLFSLGTVLYELTTGQRPFEGHGEYDTLEMIVQGRLQPPSMFVPAYPTELEDVVMKLLAREPSARYQDAESVLFDLEKLTSDAGLLVSERAVAKYMQEVFAEEIAEWENALIVKTTQTAPAFGGDIATGSGELDPVSSSLRAAATTTPYGAPVARSGLSLDLDDPPPPPSDPPHPFDSTREYPRGAGRPPSHLLPDDPPTREVKLEAATDEPLHGLLVTPDVQVFVRNTRSGIPDVNDDPNDLPIARAPSPTPSASTRVAPSSPRSRGASPSIARTSTPTAQPQLPHTTPAKPPVPAITRTPTPAKQPAPAITHTRPPAITTRTPTPAARPMIARTTPPTTTPSSPVLPIDTPRPADFADESPTTKATRDDLRRAIADARTFDPNETRGDDSGATQGVGIDPTRFDAVLQFDPILARGDDILDDVDASAPKNESKEEQALRRIIELARRARAWLASGDVDQAVIAAELAFEEDITDPLVHAIRDRETPTFHMAYETFLGDLRRPASLGRPLDELADLTLDQRAAFLLSRIDGNTSIEELLDTSGMSRFEASRHLCRLVFRRMIIVG